MAHDTQHTPARDAPIDGRSDFTAALRHAVAHALRSREREICFVDPDFETWPLDDPSLIASLSSWARQPDRRLLLVAGDFSGVARRCARFAEWRGTFAHVVESRLTDVEASQIPTLVLAGDASVMLADRLRWRGHGLASDKEVADWREVIDVLVQRSEPGFGANTLGL